MIRWQFVVVVSMAVITAYIIHPFFTKKMADIKVYAVGRMFIWTAVATIVSCIFSLSGALFGFTAVPTFDKHIFFIFLIGLLNPFANYFHWRAVGPSQSITAIFTWLDDLICIVLGLAFLSEGRFVSPLIFCGIVLVFFAVAIFAAFLPQKKPQQDGIVEEGSHRNLRMHEVFKGSLKSLNQKDLYLLCMSVLKYSCIWGTVIFLMRYFAVHGVVWGLYVPIWYFASFCGTGILLLWKRKECGSWSELRPHLRICVLFACSAFIQQSFFFWSRSIPELPIVITQPIFQVSGMIFPTLIGLFYYRERAEFGRSGWLALVIGFVGGLIIVFSF